MRITLHIGAWKTGSTAIQGFLTANREILRKHDIFIPESMERPKRPASRRQLQSTIPAETDIIISEYASLVRGHEDRAHMIVSSEHFWPLSDEAIGRVGAALFQLTQNVEIVLYTRPQDDMWNSLYCQQAKSLRVGPDSAFWGTADFVSPGIAEWAIYYHRCLGMFAKVFGADAVHARPYQRERLRGGDVALDFLDHLGVDDPDLKSPKATSNPSFGWKGVAFSLWAYENLGIKGRTEEDVLALRGAFRSVARKMSVQMSDQTWTGKAPNVLTMQQRQEIRDHYADDNRKLFDRYFAGEDVFGPVKEKPVDSISFADIPRAESDQARQKLLNVLRKRDYDVTDIASVLRPQPAKRASGLKRLMGSILNQGR